MGSAPARPPSGDVRYAFCFGLRTRCCAEFGTTTTADTARAWNNESILRRYLKAAVCRPGHGAAASRVRPLRRSAGRACILAHLVGRPWTRGAATVRAALAQCVGTCRSPSTWPLGALRGGARARRPGARQSGPTLGLSCVCRPLSGAGVPFRGCRSTMFRSHGVGPARYRHREVPTDRGGTGPGVARCATSPTTVGGRPGGDHDARLADSWPSWRCSSISIQKR